MPIVRAEVSIAAGAATVVSIAGGAAAVVSVAAGTARGAAGDVVVAGRPARTDTLRVAMIQSSSVGYRSIASIAPATRPIKDM
jgi:hypothetical protein